MRIAAVTAIIWLGNCAIGSAEYTEGPYICLLPPGACVCGYDEHSHCRPADDGRTYCVTNSDCYCQNNFGKYHYCGHWFESYTNAFGRRPLPPPGQFSPRLR
jgi:hypothetical protein